MERKRIKSNTKSILFQKNCTRYINQFNSTPQIQIIIINSTQFYATDNNYRLKIKALEQKYKVVGLENKKHKLFSIVKKKKKRERERNMKC